MKRARIAAVGIGAILAALWGTAGPVRGEEPSLKQLMGENLAGLQTILVALIKADYSIVPEPLKRIEEHAEQLTHRVPPNARKERDRFMTYAYSLRTQAKDLESIIQALTEHDQGKQQIETDSLREAAAAHYGGMVTLCVACHNRFRPSVVH